MRNYLLPHRSFSEILLRRKSHALFFSPDLTSLTNFDVSGIAETWKRPWIRFMGDLVTGAVRLLRLEFLGRGYFSAYSWLSRGRKEDQIGEKHARPLRRLAPPVRGKR